MSAQREDYLIRLITQAAAALRRLREKLAGGEAAGEIVREAQAAQGELLGPDAAMLRALDPATAARLLAEPRRLALWAELLRAEAEAYRRAGEVERATALEARASTVERVADATSR